jgi:hypothetical protein
MQGTALIGRPLDVSVEVQTDPGEDGAALCLDAEVFHADARQDQRLVRVSVDAVAAGQIANARIVSASPIDEPVVTVLLRAGCSQKTMRRYVLLADPPADVPAPVVPLVSPSTAVEPVAPAASRAASPNSLVAAVPPVIAANPASLDAAPKPVAAPVAGPVAVLPARPALPAGPRLTLSPAVPHQRRVDKPLIVAPAPVAAPASAAVLTVAATVTDGAAALAAQKIQALERDVKVALARSAGLETSLTDMKSRLQKAESERWPAELLYGLFVLVLACLLAVGWLWNRLRRLQAERGDWWSQSDMPQTDPAADLDRSQAPTMAPTLAVTAAAVAPVTSHPSPAPASAQPVEVQPETVRTEPTQDHTAPLSEPAAAGAEPSLDLDNLIDFDPSQGKQPPAASS